MFAGVLSFIYELHRSSLCFHAVVSIAVGKIRYCTHFCFSGQCVKFLIEIEDRQGIFFVVSEVLFRRVFITLFVDQVCQMRLDEFKSWRYTQLR